MKVIRSAYVCVHSYTHIWFYILRKEMWNLVSTWFLIGMLYIYYVSIAGITQAKLAQVG